MLISGKKNVLQGLFLPLVGEPGDSNYSKALILTPHICLFAFCFSTFCWACKEILITNLAPSRTKYLSPHWYVLFWCCISDSQVRMQRSPGPGSGCPIPLLLSQSLLVHGVQAPQGFQRLYLTLVIPQFHIFSSSTDGFSSSLFSCHLHMFLGLSPQAQISRILGVTYITITKTFLVLDVRWFFKHISECFQATFLCCHSISWCLHS